MVGAIVPVVYGRTGNFLRCVRPSGMISSVGSPTDSVMCTGGVSVPPDFHHLLSLHAKLSAFRQDYQFLALMLATRGALTYQVVRRQLNVIIDRRPPAVCACPANFQLRFLFDLLVEDCVGLI
jgi:hypothetical protein